MQTKKYSLQKCADKRLHNTVLKLYKTTDKCSFFFQKLSPNCRLKPNRAAVFLQKQKLHS